jgi:RNA polymerase sigma-70 factor (ECF subfamily)
VSDNNADFQPVANRAGGERPSESSLVDVFLAELGRLRRIVAGIGLGASDGEDVLQDVLVQALRQPAEYRVRQNAVRWLTKVTVNRCLTEYRNRRRFRRHASEILKRRLETEADLRTVEQKTIAAEELEIVRKSLQELDGSLLTPLVLRYFCGLNSKEVGEIMDLSPSTLRSRLRDARLILAKRLVERGIEP